MYVLYCGCILIYEFLLVPNHILVISTDLMCKSEAFILLLAWKLDDFRVDVFKVKSPLGA